MLWMIITIVVIYSIYYFWIAINFDRQGNIKSKNKGKTVSIEKKMPAEVKYFIKKYNVDLDKINYRYFLQVIGLIVSIDIAVISSVALLFERIWLQMIVIVLMVIIAILVSFGLLGNYFKKKGLTKDDKYKRNREKVAR